MRVYLRSKDHLALSRATEAGRVAPDVLRTGVGRAVLPGGFRF
jgi:hypothetical protein